MKLTIIGLRYKIKNKLNNISDTTYPNIKQIFFDSYLCENYLDKPFGLVLSNETFIYNVSVR